MADLHLLVVVDSKTGKVRVTGLNEAPVDSKGVWDPAKEVWRYATEREEKTLFEVESDIREALTLAGLYE